VLGLSAMKPLVVKNGFQWRLYTDGLTYGSKWLIIKSEASSKALVSGLTL